jgi:hypothetical protein
LVKPRRRRKMWRKSVNHGNSVTMLICLLALLGACGPSEMSSPTSTALGEPTAYPSQATAAAPPPIQAVAWEAVTVDTLCLEVEQSYPGIDEKSPEPILETTERILERLGFAFALTGAPCDATLSISLSGQALDARYSYEGSTRNCYSGAQVEGEMSLAMEGRSPLVCPVEAELEPPLSIGYCPGPSTAPFGRVWAKAVLEGLVTFWGHQTLLQALQDQDSNVRIGAAEGLGEVGAEGGVVAALIQALSDEDEPVRKAAAKALASIGPEKGVVSALMEALEDEDPYVRSGAATALGNMEPTAVEAVPALIEALEGDVDADVRGATALALGDVGREDGVVDALIEALQDEEWNVRLLAACALRNMEPPAVEAVPALIETLDDERESVRWAAARALRHISGQDFGEEAGEWEVWWEEQQ